MWRENRPLCFGTDFGEAEMRGSRIKDLRRENSFRGMLPAVLIGIKIDRSLCLAIFNFFLYFKIIKADFSGGIHVMKAIGIDIGTTTISGVIVDAESRAVVLAKTIENGSFIKTEHEWERIQDAGLIVEKAKGLLDGLLAESGGACAIGLTGQMHGILYVDEKGKCISPLYTWQDGRGNLPGPGGRSLVEEIYEKYQVKTASGYGLVTHFYNMRNYRGFGTDGKKEESALIFGQRTVSGKAASLCTIAD